MPATTTTVFMIFRSRPLCFEAVTPVDISFSHVGLYAPPQLGLFLLALPCPFLLPPRSSIVILKKEHCHLLELSPNSFCLPSCLRIQCTEN